MISMRCVLRVRNTVCHYPSLFSFNDAIGELSAAHKKIMIKLPTTLLVHTLKFKLSEKFRQKIEEKEQLHVHAAVCVHPS